jgi:nucleoside-diphosphate-sugar epimerase
MCFAGYNVEALLTSARVPPVLVTGATGRIGRAAVAQLLDAGVPVRALTPASSSAGGFQPSTPFF